MFSSVQQHLLPQTLELQPTDAGCAFLQNAFLMRRRSVPPSRKRDEYKNAMLKQQERSLLQGPALIAAVKQKMKEIYLSKPPMSYRCEGPAVKPIRQALEEANRDGREMHCHRLMPIPRITNRIARQMQLTPFLRSVKASREHFARCFACSNWDAPA